MTNDVAKTAATGGALAAAAALKGNLKKAKAAIPETQSSQYLRFLQDGNWVFGQENEEVRPDDAVALNSLSIKTGWSCWTDRPGRGAKNENLGEVMVPLGVDAVQKSDLPTKKDAENGDAVCPWREQISVDVMILSGPNKGKQVHYKTTSMGGMGAMNATLDQIMMQLDEDPVNIIPVISLGSDHYNHKKYGRTYTPVIKITGWMSLDDDAMTPTAVIEETSGDAEYDDDYETENDMVEDEIVEEATSEPEQPRRRRR